MGHFCATCTRADTQIVQELPAFAPKTGALVYLEQCDLHLGQRLTDQRRFRSPMESWRPAPIAQSKKMASGHSPVISSNGASAAVLWQLDGGTLNAFDASTLATL